jgi:beta-glucosidase
MGKVSSLLKRLLFVVLGLLVLVVVGAYVRWKWIANANHKLLGERVLTIGSQGHRYRDLNKNGQLDPYEDNRLPTAARVDNLVSLMTLEEKAGLMFITIAGMNKNGSPLEMPDITNPMSFYVASNSTLLARQHINHFNTIQSPSAEALAEWNNQIQVLAERTRLGIPVTIATDPRNGAGDNPGAVVATPFFSQWCSPLGFAAIGDTVLMRTFGEMAREEYLTVGIRLALSPMADLATEPRWGRIFGTFGEDAHLSARLTKAYILGFQGDSLGTHSVACMAKHFAGAGPQKDGEDAHFPYGREQVYPGNNFDYHLIPFEQGVFPAGAAQIMPYYGIPVGQTSEDVGFGYNKDIITGLLRERYGFDGVICTDWGLVTESMVKPPAAWGVEHLSEIERVAKILDAGCDMFGGEACPELVIELVKTGRIPEARIDASVRRILRDKFRLGLFDNPFVKLGDLWKVGQYEKVEKGKESMRRSLVLLKNQGNILPLKAGTKVYVEGLDTDPAWQHGEVVKSPAEADVIIQKLSTPFDPRDTYLIERYFRQGRLHFTDAELQPIRTLAGSGKPVITIINLERPAVIPEINTLSRALIADFDSSDEVLFELLFGKFAPSGKLPFELPASVEAVKQQKEDVPYDSPNPLYPFGAGLGY